MDCSWDSSRGREGREQSERKGEWKQEADFHFRKMFEEK